MPNYLEYHQSVTNELHVLKNRVRNLVTYADETREDPISHWLTDGEHKESALRAVIRRHIANNIIVGRGFIVTEDESSTQIDILIVDGDAPTLFRDGDLMIVTPDAVLACIEVKTSLTPWQETTEAIAKLARLEHMASRYRKRNKMWTGLFVYEDNPSVDDNHRKLLKAIKEGCGNLNAKLNCISYGHNTFTRYWTADAVEWGQGDNIPDGESWRSYELDRIAPTYFISNLLDSISQIDRPTSAYAWFPSPGGKYQRRTWVLRLQEEEPISHDECVSQRRVRSAGTGHRQEI